MINFEQIRAYRLRAHHLDQKLPPDALETAAGACGLQNSPPGAWETAAYNRLTDCTLRGLQNALYKQKNVLQAWSYRGVPVVFPTNQSAVFLSPLAAQKGEEPWIYTRGITLALEHLQMTFDELLPLVEEAAHCLEEDIIKSKEALDQRLADSVEEMLALDKQLLWRSPSMYGSPDRQTVGGAVVSFMLRPCAFETLVVFGERQVVSPTFTAFINWIGHAPAVVPEAEKELVRKFLRCYGPTTSQSFMEWLGCSPKQAKRLWHNIAEELMPIEVPNKTAYLLASEEAAWQSADLNENKLLLLGAHDPYLDMQDKTVILENKTLHKQVWRMAANPGVVLKGGRIVGVWKAKQQKDKLTSAITLYEPLTSAEKVQLTNLVEEYADFRLLYLKNLTIEE